MNLNAAVWFEIYVTDMRRAVRFYEGITGKKLENISGSREEYMIFPTQAELKGIGGALVKCHGEPGRTGTRIYFSCEDCSESAVKAEAFGGKIITKKQQIGEFGFISLVEDTEGNIVGFHSLV